MGDLIILAEFVKQRSLATGSCDPQPSTSRKFTNYDWLPLFQTENEHLKSSVNQPACAPNLNDAGIVFHRGQSPVESIQFEMAPKAKARCCSYIHTYTSVDPETSMRKKPARLRIPEFSAETGGNVTMPDLDPDTDRNGLYWIPSLRLTDREHAVLKDPYEQLTTPLIDAATYLLKKNVWDCKLAIGGLDYQTTLQHDIRQNTFLEEEMAVQILHVTGHWQVVARFAGELNRVHFFCSLGWRMNAEIQRVLGHLLKQPEKSEVIVQYHVMQKQSGGIDCGLFAVFIAHCIINGIPPSSTVTVEQSSMRRHFLQCCSLGEMSRFPVSNSPSRLQMTKIGSVQEVIIPALWHNSARVAEPAAEPPAKRVRLPKVSFSPSA